MLPVPLPPVPMPLPAPPVMPPVPADPPPVPVFPPAPVPPAPVPQPACSSTSATGAACTTAASAGLRERNLSGADSQHECQRGHYDYLFHASLLDCDFALVKVVPWGAVPKSLGRAATTFAQTIIASVAQFLVMNLRRRMRSAP